MGSRQLKIASDVSITSIPIDYEEEPQTTPVANPDVNLLQIQLMSDIHLEFPGVWRRFPLIKPS